MLDEQRGRFLIDSSITTECKVSVVVPVCNEARHLPLTLPAFARQKDSRGNQFDARAFELIILANNCTDDSVAIIKRFQSENPQLKIHLREISLSAENANIGFVRRLLMNEAFYRLQTHRENGVILTTDGDTTVAPDWIAANLREIENGADAVGGRIIIAPEELAAMDANCRDFYLKDEKYRLLAAEIEALIDDIPHDAAPRHHQHFNGSFAVTTDAYARAGGVPKVRFLEDVAFYEALQRIDAKFRHSPLVKVYTSSRHEGRSEVGLSYQLNEWRKLGECGADFLVESAPTIEKRLRAKRNLREAWRRVKTFDFPATAEIYRLSEQLHISSEFLVGELSEITTFGNLYEKVMREQARLGEWEKRHLPVSLSVALKGLSEIISLKTRREANVYSFSQTSSR